MAAPYLLGADGKLIRNGVVRFAADGTVLGVEQCDRIDSLPQTEYHNGILIPGMTNAHCHLELSFFKGAIPQHAGMVEFIHHVVSKRNDYSREEQVARAIEEDLFMWREGIQAVGDISNDTASFPAKVKAKAEGRTRYHTFAEFFGMPADDEAEAFYHKSVDPLLAAARADGLEITPTQHSTYFMSDKLFKLAAHSPLMSIHFMETPAEVEFFDRKGGIFKLVSEAGGREPDFLAYGGHAERLVGSLPKDAHLVLIHNTQMRRKDMELILDYFEDVTFVLCPRSNYYIDADFPPAQMLYEAGARVALGTDSLSSNTSLSLTEEIKWVSAHNPDIPLAAVLQWATLNGARALRFGNEIGSFETGKRPGAVLLTGVDFSSMTLTDNARTVRLL